MPAVGLTLQEFAAIFGTHAEREPGRSQLCRFCGGWHRLDRLALPEPKRATRGQARAFIDAATAYVGADCLMWPFSLKDNGYASVGSRDQKRYAHRIVCEARNGPPNSPRDEAAHCCGNRSCVNPQHLRWASHAENHADRIIHGTSNRGERNGNALLTAEAVRVARAKYALGVSLQTLSRSYGVARDTMRNAVLGYTWSWVK